MAPARRRLVRNLAPNPFEQTETPGVVSNVPDDTKTSKYARNNVNVAQYPYPSPDPPINAPQDTPSKTPSHNQLNSTLITTQGGNGSPQTVVQAPQQISELAIASTSVVSTTTTTSVFSSSTSISSLSSRSTAVGSTLSVPPPNFSTRLTTIPLSLSYRSQTFSDTESSSISTSQSTADDTTSTSPPPLQLSPTAIGVLIAIGGTILLVAIICILRFSLRQCRHRRRRMKESAFDFSRSNENNPWETGDGEKSGGMGTRKGYGSPSTIFGGNERSTPQPSWMTFHETDRAGTASPYPLGLLPPPVKVQRAPSLRAHTGLGISHQAFHTGYSNYNHGTMARQVDPRNQSFEPPTITITNSSPRQSAPWVAKQFRHRNSAGAGAPKPSSSGTDISPSNSYNRVSVYADPMRGAQLVKPPRLTLVNDEPSLSESDGGPRQSGWSSWDDGVGLELGVTIDRKHLPPRRKSRIPVSKGKKGISPLRTTLAPVQEVSDTSDAEAIKKSPARSVGTPTSKLHPQGPYGSRGQLRRGPSSPTTLRRSPRSAKSASPRALKQPQPQTLYDLPQFEALSPSGNSSTRVASPNSAPSSPLREPEREPDRATGSSKRRSKRSSRRASSKHHPVAAARPSSVVSEALSDMYAYVHAYALSSTESEEIQVRRRSKPKSPRSPKLKDGDRLAPYGSTLAMGSSPAVSDTVGALMMKAYGEDGSIPSPSILQLSEKGKGSKSGSGRKEIPMKESNRVNLPQAGHSVGLGLTIQKQRSQTRQQPSVAPQSTRYRNTSVSAGNSEPFSPQSEYSEHPNQHPAGGYPDSSRLLPTPQQRGVPSLPPPGMPNLHQQRLMRDMPDYRSPTYSVYGMYRDENRASPLQNSPVQYRYASSTTGGKARTGNGNGARLAWRADVI